MSAIAKRRPDGSLAVIKGGEDTGDTLSKNRAGKFVLALRGGRRVPTGTHYILEALGIWESETCTDGSSGASASPGASTAD